MISNSEFEASVPVNPASSNTANGLAPSGSTGAPPRSAMPVICGVAMVHVCSMRGGATMPPKRDAAANSGSV